MHVSSYFQQTPVYGELTHGSFTDQVAMHEKDQRSNLGKQLLSLSQNQEGTIPNTIRKLTHLPSLNLIAPPTENLNCWEKTQIVAAMNPSFPEQESNKPLLEEKNVTPLSTTEASRKEQSIPIQNMSQTENAPSHSNSEQMVETPQLGEHLSQGNSLSCPPTSEPQIPSNSSKKIGRNIGANFTRALNEQSTHFNQENRTNEPVLAQPRTNVNPPSPTPIRETAPHRVEGNIAQAATTPNSTDAISMFQRIYKVVKRCLQWCSKIGLSLIDKGKFLFKQLGGTALKISNQLRLIFYQRQEHTYNAPVVQHITHNHNYYSVSNGSSPTRCSEEQFRQTSTPSVPMAAATA